MSEYEISVPVRRPVVALLMLVPLGIWYGFLQVSSLLVRGVLGPESGVEFFFCLLLGLPFALICVVVGLALVRLILYNLLGKETLRVERSHLLIRGSLFGLGRWKRFPVEKISDLRTGRSNLQAGVARSFHGTGVADWLRVQRWSEGLARLYARVGAMPGILFKVDGQVHGFGACLGDGQAQEILVRLKFHLPEDAFAVTEEALTLFKREEES